jgi:hypothetical protein
MPGGEKRTIPHLIDALNVGGAQELPVLLVKKTPKSLYQILVCVIQPNNRNMAHGHLGIKNDKNCRNRYPWRPGNVGRH